MIHQDTITYSAIYPSFIYYTRVNRCVLAVRLQLQKQLPLLEASVAKGASPTVALLAHWPLQASKAATVGQSLQYFPCHSRLISSLFSMAQSVSLFIIFHATVGQFLLYFPCHSRLISSVFSMLQSVNIFSIFHATVGQSLQYFPCHSRLVSSVFSMPQSVSFLSIYHVTVGQFLQYLLCRSRLVSSVFSMPQSVSIFSILYATVGQSLQYFQCHSRLVSSVFFMPRTHIRIFELKVSQCFQIEHHCASNMQHLGTYYVMIDI